MWFNDAGGQVDGPSSGGFTPGNGTTGPSESTKEDREGPVQSRILDRDQCAISGVKPPLDGAVDLSAGVV